MNFVTLLTFAELAQVERPVPMRCQNCRFAVEISDDEFECHRYPPTVIYDGQFFIKSHWRFVDKNDWCGEFEPSQLALEESRK